MARTLPRWPCLWALLILWSCDGRGGDGNDVTLGTNPPSRPVVSVIPPPGSYRAYEMPVTVSVTGEATLFYDIGRIPDTTANLAYESQFTVQLKKSSRLNVMVRDDRGNISGPYIFEFHITRPLPNGGGCAVAPLNKYWYRGAESVVVSIDYQLPLAISQLEAIVDGKAISLSHTDDSQGTRVVDLGRLSHGAHEIGCRVRSLDLPDIDGEPIAMAVDSQNPMVAWLDAGGTFSHETWPGYFRLQVTDAASGVGSVEVCDGAQFRCMPMLDLTGGEYAFATALTSQASGGGALTARVSDVAGNVVNTGSIIIDLSGFAEPPAPAAPPITMTTGAVLDFPLFLGRGVSEVCDLSLTSCYAPTAVDLAIGWNDFLFRTPGRLEWESLGIYRNGVRVQLPTSAFPWLIYSSNGLAPMMQSALVAVTADVTDWQRAWFEIPHLYFVEDVTGNGRWDQYDNLFTVSTDRFSDPLLASMTPLDLTPVQFLFGSQPATMTVSVTCAQDCGAPGRLYFERRASMYAYPETHVDLGPVFAASYDVPATTNDGCLFFWDENADGVVNGTEPRSIALCSNSVSLARQTGVLAWEILNAAQQRLTGIPFGGMVTRSIEYLSSTDEPLVTRSLLPFVDSDGDGFGYQLVGGFQDDGPILGVKARLVFRYGSQVTWVTLATSAAPSQPYQYQVGVSDETGAPIAALVSADQAGFINIGIADTGALSLGMPALLPYPTFFAYRDGYLSVATSTTDVTVSLKLLSPAVTGLISGLVVDTYGDLVSNATISWSAPPYSAKALSGPGGGYAIAASGGTGILTIKAPGKFVRMASYTLDVTRTSVVQAVVVPADEDLWPAGLRLNLSPDVTGADVLKFVYGDFYYAAQISGESPLDVEWLRMHRQVDPTGFLPASPGTFGNYLSATHLPFLAETNSRAVCGARSQSALGGLHIDSSCWSWVGDEDGRDYYFGRLGPQDLFPPVLGLGRAIVYVLEGGSIPPNQILNFHEKLMGQTLRIELRNGLIVGHLPLGVYQITTDGGTYLADSRYADEVTEFAIAENYPATFTLYIP